MIVIIDYNVGNLKSVEGAFLRVGMDVVVSRDKEVIKKADGIVLPGVGTFLTAMNNLKKFGLIDILKERKEAGIPILGICLGMQILFEEGYEVAKCEGLGFIPGKVEYMDIDEKIPHMGWNQLHFRKESPILKYLKENDDVYFVHSYMANCPKEYIVANSDYGNLFVTAIVQKDNVIGCQFHPEKSGAIGQKILLAFKEVVEC